MKKCLDPPQRLRSTSSGTHDVRTCQGCVVILDEATLLTSRSVDSHAFIRQLARVGAAAAVGAVPRIAYDIRTISIVANRRQEAMFRGVTASTCRGLLTLMIIACASWDRYSIKHKT